MIRIQSEDFKLDDIHRQLRSAYPEATGAICIFTGLVRDFGDRDGVQGIFLEHYPTMTEKQLADIVAKAEARWSLHKTIVIHRIGQLSVTDQIVLVGVAAAHRSDAFAACEFIMDFLKKDATFWKKELSKNGDQWVEARESDMQKAQRWTDQGK